MRYLFSLLILVLVSSASVSQVNPTGDEEKNMKTLVAATDTGWSSTGNITIGVTGSYFNQWAAGGINSVGLNSLLNYSKNYRRDRNAWDNTLVVAFGMLNQGFATSSSWIKTDDRFDFTSKYGRQISEKLYYAGLLNFNTQFAPGYATGANGLPDRSMLISNFAAPARLMLSIGLDYKPNENLSIFLSPITYRGIYVFDDLLAARGSFGVEEGIVIEDTLIGGVSNDIIVKHGARARHELGAYLRIAYAKKFSDNFNLTSKLELFSNYLDKPQNVDLAFEAIGAWKIGKFFSFTATLNFLYDDNTVITKTKTETINNDDGSITTISTPYESKGLQTRIISTLGLTYNF